MNFDEMCRRASGRRAYNARRRQHRAARISALLIVQRRLPELSGRDLAARFGVHEATISRDLKFINKVRDEYRRDLQKTLPWLETCELQPSSFRWLRGGRGYETVFEIRDGARVK